MDKDRLVTILMSVKNGSETLDRCLESIFNQTFKDFSVLCINDFSTDNGKTLAILTKWRSKFETNQFRIINNEIGLGLTESLNRGLKIIESKYAARIDADDWWHIDKLKRQMEFLKNNPTYEVIGCNYINFGNSFSKKIYLPENDADIRKFLPKRNPFAHSCVIFKTALIKKLNGYDKDITYGQDYDLWWKCYPYAKFYNLPHFLCYRSIGKGISSEKQRDQMKQGIKTQIKYFRKYDLPLKNYLYIFELLMLIIIPDFIKKIKRKYVG